MRLPDILRLTIEPVLKSYGFTRSAEEHNPDWEVVVYANPTTAVRVYRETREPGCMVQLFKMKGSELPLNWGVDERAADPDNGYDVLDLLAIRGIQTPDILESCEEWLAWLANLLEETSGDVLRGDFTVFASLAEVVAKRRKEAQS